jgi:hypothetical protein
MIIATDKQITEETARTTTFVVSAAESSPSHVFLNISDDMEDGSFWLTPERARQLAAELVAQANAADAQDLSWSEQMSKACGNTVAL